MNADDWMDQMDLQSKAGKLDRLVTKLTEQNKIMREALERIESPHTGDLVSGTLKFDRLADEFPFSVAREALSKCGSPEPTASGEK